LASNFAVQHVESPEGHVNSAGVKNIALPHESISAPVCSVLGWLLVGSSFYVGIIRHPFGGEVNFGDNTWTHNPLEQRIGEAREPNGR
jgi:hypothetical protein